MQDHEKYLYMIVFPTNALVASQLPPDKFGEHYTGGLVREGKQGKDDRADRL